MGKKQKPDPKVEQQKSLAIIDTPSVGEQALTEEATALRDWIKAGDYRTRPKNLFFNFADPASRDRQRRIQLNAGAQGVAGLGAPNANLLALNKQHLDDIWARDTAGQYESDVSQAGIRAAGMLGDVAQLEQARKLGRLGATTSSYNTQLNKPSWWQTLLSQAGQGAMAAATFASDERLKYDITPIRSALDKVEDLQGYTYRWNRDGVQFGHFVGKPDVGVIAQEVEAVLPALVSENESGFKTVNYNGLVGLLVSAVNELSARVKQLEAERNEKSFIPDPDALFEHHRISG